MYCGRHGGGCTVTADRRRHSVITPVILQPRTIVIYSGSVAPGSQCTADPLAHFLHDDKCTRDVYIGRGTQILRTLSLRHC